MARKGRRKGRGPATATAAAATAVTAATAATATVGGGAAAPPPASKRWWQHLFSLPGLVVAIVAGIMVVWGFWDKIGTVSRADVRASLASCKSDEIRLVLRNRGGKVARINRPHFAIRSPFAQGELPIEAFTADDPFSNAVRTRGSALKGGDTQELLYEGRVPFFSAEESAGGNCTISVRVPVSPDSGRHPDAEAQCRCGS